MSNNPPAFNGFRVRCTGTYASSADWGVRFYLAYNGGPPVLGDTATLASEVETSWSTHMLGAINTAVTLTGIEVTDMSSETGVQTVTTPSVAGTRSGASLPDDVAANISFKISRRYRGGHPKIFLPFGSYEDISGPAEWDSTALSQFPASWDAFIAAVVATSGLTVDDLNHAAVSLYSGYLTIGPGVNGKYKYPPKARETAIVDAVSSYALNPVVGSQRRRRTATTP